jgi:ABC-2 type transport system ATP-binding protein
VKDLLVELKRRGKTILLSSHLLSDVEDVCDRMTILYGGKIHAEGTAEELLVDSEHTVIKIPRLHNDGTIAKIERILEESEGTSIESVEQPRQNLESFFIQIVDKAREARAETSGANVGDTAPFLKGDEEGEDLIDKLVEQEDEEVRASEKTKSSSTAKQDNVILKSLVQTEEIDVRATEATDQQVISTEADSEMIDSLIQNQEDESSQDTK